MIILQNILGAECAELAEMTHASHAGFHPVVMTRFDASPRRAVWGKIRAIQHWLGKAKPGATALFLDADTFLHRAIEDTEFPEPAELGIVFGAYEDLKWINSGVLFLRATDRLREFFQRVWDIGPQPYLNGCPEGGDQGAIQTALCGFGLEMAIMPNAYNAYTFAPCEQPIISAFHGLPHAEKVRAMSDLIAPQLAAAA